MACRVWARVGRLPVGVRWGCTLGAHATGATAAGRRAVAAVAVRWWDQHAWSHSSATRLYSTTPHTRVGVSNDRHGVATSVIPQPSVNAKLALLCRGEDFQAVSLRCVVACLRWLLQSISLRSDHTSRGAHRHLTSFRRWWMPKRQIWGRTFRCRAVLSAKWAFVFNMSVDGW